MPATQRGARPEPEMDGSRATRSLAAIRAGVKSAREGHVVEVEEVLASGE